jgi:NADH-quinone oxidoreductase subunit G
MSIVKININGKDYEVEPGRNLLHTCLALGFNIPYFCYHPALGSVGACRQCAVKKYRNADDKHGRIIMSCMEPVADGLIISTDDKEVLDFRRAVIEALMTNHPHDCPVCDEGGECHLQDMTVMTGHDYRRFIFKKRTYLNQDLGPYVNHEMNRCIQCYRCVRFYRDYAGGKDLHVFGSAARVYFGRFADGKLESPFSGNLVEVCPTGVFTDKTLGRHYTRKWDLSNAPSICNKCSVGCNILVSERYGTVRRILSRYNPEVNGYFICDKGRFDYEYINSHDRIREITFSSEKNITNLGSVLCGNRIIGIGSATASLESNYALQKLVGKENFYNGIPGAENETAMEAVNMMRSGDFHIPSLFDVEKSDAVLLLGDDPMVTAPMLGLAILQATRNQSFEIAAKTGIPLWNDAAVRDIAHNVYSPLFMATPAVTALDEKARKIFRGDNENISKFGNDIAAVLRKEKISGKTDKTYQEIVNEAASVFSEAKNPLIVAGFNMNVLHTAGLIAGALKSSGKQASLAVTFPQCNSVGLAMLGGKPYEDLLKSTEQFDCLVILENDLYRLADKRKTESLFKKFRNIILLHHTKNDTAKDADIVMPSGTFAESTGTIVSYEGRAQRYYRVLPSDGKIKDSWKHIAEMMQARGGYDNEWKNFDDVAASLAKDYPFYTTVNESFPGAGFRIGDQKVARQTPGYSGRTAMYANINVHEQKPPVDNDAPLNFSMEGYKGVPPASLVTYYRTPGWNSPQAINKYLKAPGGDPLDGNTGVRLFDIIKIDLKK